MSVRIATSMAAFITVLTASLSATPPASAAEVGGVLSQDTTWTQAGGPYVLTSTIQIPDNVTLHVEPGTHIEVGPYRAFLVAGSLQIRGSTGAPVVVSGTGGRLTDHTGQGAEVLIQHAIATDFSGLWNSINGSGHVTTVEDSRFINDSSDSTEIDFIRGRASILRNEFFNSGLLAPGGSLDGSPVPIEIRNNRFDRSTSDPWYAPVWLPRGVAFTGNAFAPGSWAALRADDIFADEPERLDVEGNYWGTTDPTAISARISDYYDDISNPMQADFTPFLSAPPTEATFRPLAPSDVAALRGSESATVSWQPPISDGGAPVSAYVVTTSPGGTTTTVAGSARTATVAGLADGTAYTFTVSAINAVGTSPASEPSNPVVPASAPEAPINVTATAGNSQAVVRWEPPSNAPAEPITGYRVRVAGGGSPVTVGAASLQTTISGLTNGQSYTFTVTAVNNVGEGSASNPSNAVTPTGPPARVAKPTAMTKQRQVKVMWSAPKDNGSPISMYAVTNSGGKTKTVSGTSTSIVFKRLKPGIYKFRVIAKNAVGSSTPSRPVKAVIKR